MTYVCRNIDYKALDGNRYYWKFTKLPPADINARCWIVRKMFKLYSNVWKIEAFVYNGFIFIKISNITKRGSEYSYDVQTGLVGDSLKEVPASRDKFPERLKFYLKFDPIFLAVKELYIFIEIRSKKENIRRIKDRKQKIETDFRDLLLSGKNSDVTIQVKHKKFKCHRVILSARSPVFSAMMEHGMEKKVSDVVKINDADPDVFQEFLLYLYSGNDDFVSCENVIDLYRLARWYHVDDLKNVCIKDIKDTLNERIYSTNFGTFFLLSQLFNDLEMEKKTIQFFLANSKKIVRHRNWMALLSQNPFESNKLITALADISVVPCQTIQCENSHFPGRQENGFNCGFKISAKQQITIIIFFGCCFISFLSLLLR